jgi:phosphoribosylaminoimidazole-succinocarboxamide synthase
MDIIYDDLVKDGLWSAYKKPVNKIGELALLEEGFQLYFEGNFTDFYLKQNINKPHSLLMYRNDSIYIDNNLIQIEGRGNLLKKISDLGIQFVEHYGLGTVFEDKMQIKSEKISVNSNFAKLSRQLEMFTGSNIGSVPISFIFRNYMTKRQYNLIYGIYTPKGESEIEHYDTPVFTPMIKSTNKKVDKQLVMNSYGHIVNILRDIVIDFTEYAYDRGLVVFDTRFDIFIDEHNNWCIGNNIFNTLSTKFVSIDDFEKSNYNSIDKHYIANYYHKKITIERSNQLININSLKSNLLKDVYNEALDGYKEIYCLLS